MSKLTSKEKEILRLSGVESLPNDPSARGFNANEIKKRMSAPASLVFDWLARLIGEIDKDFDKFPYFAKNLEEAKSSYELKSGDVVVIYGDDFGVYSASIQNGSVIFNPIGNTLSSTKAIVDTISSNLNSLTNKHEQDMEALESGSAVVGHASKSNNDGNGNDIVATYETKTSSESKYSSLIRDIVQGVIIAKKAASDDSGNPIADTYETKSEANAKHASLISGETIVGKANKDGNGNVISSYYVPWSSVVDNLTSTSSSFPLSAKQGNLLSQRIEHIYTLLGSDDASLDTLQEVVDYVKNHSSLLEGITTSKASISDLQSGTLIVKKAESDSNGNKISDTYSTISSLTGGSLIVAKSSYSETSLKAEQDSLGRKFEETYALLSSISGVSLTASEVEEIYKSI